MPLNSTTGRRYLLYCPVNGGECAAELLGEDRLFDVAVNDWTGSAAAWDGAEYLFRTKGHKWPCIVENLPRIDRQYDFYAFFDFDVTITTADLNRLFQVGAALGLDLFQAALSLDSTSNYSHLFVQPKSLVRETRFVEVMMPVFSRSALERCRWTFEESISGYGLDYLWAKSLQEHRMAIVDAVVAQHIRPIGSAQWRLENGFTPLEELNHLLKKHQIRLLEFRRPSITITPENAPGKMSPP